MKCLKIVPALLLAFSCLFFSCREKDAIVFNEADLEALDIEYQWAVVKIPYVACRENPSYEAKVVKNLRKDMMGKIVGERTVKVVDGDDEKYEKWLALDDGWIPENSVSVYMNRMRAEKAVKGE